MALFFISVVVGLIANIWVAVRMWPVSKVYALGSLAFFPVAIFFMFAHWSDPDHDIKFPFIITLVATIVFGYQANKLEKEYVAETTQEQTAR
jgi:hypothetical protein